MDDHYVSVDIRTW